MRPAALVGACLLLALPSIARADDTWTDPHPGVRHLHRTASGPVRLHVLEIDLCAPGVRLRATTSGERRSTPSSFGMLVGAQAAVNGDFFDVETYAPVGLAMGAGMPWPDSVDPSDHGFVAFGRRRAAISVPAEVVDPPAPWTREAVGGVPELVVGGEPILDHTGSLCDNRHPRTAVGLSEDGRTMWLAVVDGRSSVSQGMDCAELAMLLWDLGAHTALNLDGGSSSAMWVEGEGVVNSPSDGSERTVANHLGVFATGRGVPETCPRQPLPPAEAVRRRVTSADTMVRWAFDERDVVSLPDAELDAYRDGPDWPEAPPVLVQAEGDPAVYVLEHETRRHVPSAAAMDAWEFDWDAIEMRAPDDLEGVLQGPAVTTMPFLAQGSGADVYVVDRPPPLWAEVVESSFPEVLGAGEVAEASVRYRNVGSRSWRPDDVILVPSSVRDRSAALCDDSWADCKTAAMVSAETPPGETAELRFTVRAPDDHLGETLDECFNLRVADNLWFSDDGQGGPADDAVCASVAVVEPGTAGDGGPGGGGTGGVGGGCGCAAASGTGSGLSAAWLLIGLAWLGRRTALGAAPVGGAATGRVTRSSRAPLPRATGR